MILSIIAALDDGRGIGIKNQLPWHMPGDLRRFRMLTMGHHLILGRKTYQSIGKPLPGRQMIVLSRNTEFDVVDGQVVSTLEEALQVAREAGESEAFISGGADIYQQALPLVEKMYLTRIHTTSQADVFFPEFDSQEWQKICEQTYPADQENPFVYTFTYLIRKISP
jgi:dihydrofolate reductase